MVTQNDPTPRKKRAASLDYYLILATVGVLFALSIICVYGMFYFKVAAVQQLPAPQKIVYMHQMNSVVAPFIIGLILLLGVCVPKRLLPASMLVYVAVILSIVCVAISVWQGLKVRVFRNQLTTQGS